MPLLEDQEILLLLAQLQLKEQMVEIVMLVMQQEAEVEQQLLEVLILQLAE